MSAPPIGMMISTPSRNASAVIDDERQPCRSASAMKNQMPKPTIAMRERQIQHVLAREHDRRALEQAELYLPDELAERDHRAGERDRADERADEELELVAGAGSAPARSERRRVVAPRRSRCSTAARPTSECIAATSSGICVICTRLRDDGADRAADGDAARGSCRRSLRRRVDQRQRDEHGDRHADHAEAGCRGAPCAGATGP